MNSVILCTHNPRKDFLPRTIASLKGQSLATSEWELIIVDNGSNIPVSSTVDLDWHPQARVVREEKLGLTEARLKGISDSNGQLLVFVDDDNILHRDYLSEALLFEKTTPWVGVWGGSSLPEFESPPPDWSSNYQCYLALRRVERLVWSNEYRFDIIPMGAGLCIRKSIAEAYARTASTDPLRLSLGRKGNNLSSGEDSDMAFTAIDHGYGMALSPRLSLTHIMPSSRLRIEYLERLVEGIACSTLILLHLRKLPIPTSSGSRLQRLLNSYQNWRQPLQIRRLEKARSRGYARGRAILQQLPT